MRLPLLDQTVELERGEALLLAHAVERFLASVAISPPLHWQTAFVLKPFARLLTRLRRRYQVELYQTPRPGKRPRLNRVRLEYDELVAVRLYYLHLLEQLPQAPQLPVVLGRFHQKSCNLEPHIWLPK